MTTDPTVINIPILLASILGLGFLSQLAAWWLKLPAILFLLIAGMTLGGFDLVDPDQLFGDLLFPLVSLSVAIILFEGSLTLKFNQLKEIQRVVLNLISIGMLTTWILVTMLTHYVVGFSWELSFLFGAIMVVTGPTVIVPMIRAIRPNNRIAQILRWEGILIDPIGALLAVLVFEYIAASTGTHSTGHAFLVFAEVILIGSFMGAIGGYLLGKVLQHHILPEYLHNLLTLTSVLLVYVCSNELAEESGLLAVTIMGIWLANTKNIDIEDILSFKEDLTILLVSCLFIVLAARVELEQIEQLGWAGFALLLGVQFIVRPIKIAISTLGSSLTIQERVLLSWVAPRGIVAAAVTAIFALKLQNDHSFEEASLLVPLTFMIIIGTVIFQSATARHVANALGVSEPEPHGFLIVGANRLGRMIGRMLKEKGFRVLITDTSWEKVRDANMDGLTAYYGDVTSVHADKHLDLIGLGRLLALSSRDDSNNLASLRFMREFGRKNTFSLFSSSRNVKAAYAAKGIRRLFSEQYNYPVLEEMIRKGAELKSTTLSEKFTYQNYLELHADRMVVFFIISPRGQLHIMNPQQTNKPQAGWEVISLILPKPE